ncbi:hypothetical protein LLG39_12795 [bacterium]|nr:hypothetical protein [bacterium]
MQVRVCPNCGIENQRSRTVCSECHASLATVTLSVSTKADAPEATVAQPAAVATATMEVTATPPAPEPTLADIAPTSMGPKPYVSAPVEVKQGFGFGYLVLGIIILAGIAIAFWPRKFVEPKVPATKVVESFLQAKRVGSVEYVKPYLTKASIKALERPANDRQFKSAGITPREFQKMLLFGIPPTADQIANSTIKADLVQDKDADKYTRIVHANLDTKIKSNPIARVIDSFNSDYYYVLFLEDGKWKVDLNATNKRSLGLGPTRLPFGK